MLHVDRLAWALNRTWYSPDSVLKHWADFSSPKSNDSDHGCQSMLISWSIFFHLFRVCVPQFLMAISGMSQPVPVGPQNSNLMRCWMPRLRSAPHGEPQKVSCKMLAVPEKIDWRPMEIPFWLWLVHANFQILTILTLYILYYLVTVLTHNQSPEKKKKWGVPNCPEPSCNAPECGDSEPRLCVRRWCA